MLILRFTVYYFCWCESRITFRRFAEISGDFIAGGINVAGNTHPIRSTWSHFRFYVRAHDVGELVLWYLFTCLFFYIGVVCLFEYHFRLWYSAFSFKQKWRLLFNKLNESNTLLLRSLTEFYYAVPKIELVYRVWLQHNSWLQKDKVICLIKTY